MSKRQKQTSLFPTPQVSAQPSRVGLRYTYSMRHPNAGDGEEEEQIITSTSLKEAYSKMIGAHYYDLQDDDPTPTLKEFSDEMAQSNYFEITEFLRVNRTPTK